MIGWSNIGPRSIGENGSRKRKVTGASRECAETSANIARNNQVSLFAGVVSGQAGASPSLPDCTKR
jgi:hypothetical protein